MNKIATSLDGRLILPWFATPAPVNARRTVAERNAPPTDRVELSSVGEALAGVKSEADMRLDRITQVRKDIRAGTYDVEGKIDAVIDRILDDVMA